MVRMNEYRMILSLNISSIFAPFLYREVKIVHYELLLERGVENQGLSFLYEQPLGADIHRVGPDVLSKTDVLFIGAEFSETAGHL
ncbi:MAG: hypothetical protein ABSA71_04175 [Desulfomonilia bacterium]